MEDRRDAVILENLGEEARIREIPLDELSPLHRFPVTPGEVVEGDGVVTPFVEHFYRLGTDVARAAGHKDHEALSLK